MKSAPKQLFLPGDSSLRAKCLYFLLLPAIRFCIRHSISLQDFTHAARHGFVRTAEEHLRKQGHKVNPSRLSAVTGITRNDVARLLGESVETERTSMSVLNRVIGYWEQNAKYNNKSGHPRPLRFRGEPAEFKEMVHGVSKHLNPGSVLFELERLGVVERQGEYVQRIRQLASPNRDMERYFELLRDEMDSLISCVEENIGGETQPPNLHVRTFYDNIFIRDLPRIREWFIAEGKAFHRKARDFLSAFDKDVVSDAPADEPAGGYVSVSIFSMTTPPALEIVSKRETEDMPGKRPVRRKKGSA